MKFAIVCSTLLLCALLHPISAEEEIGIIEEQPAPTAERSTLQTDTTTTVTDQNRPDQPGESETTVQTIAPPVSNPDVGTIIITTTPDCATIDINGTNLGITPWNRSGFIPGFYRITLEKDGYHRFQKTVEINSGDTIRIQHNFTESATRHSQPSTTAATVSDEATTAERANTNMEPVRQPQQVGNGTITVSCNTDSANVVVNKVKVGVTPFSRSGFRPGWYEVELKKSGYEPFREMVKVENDSTVRIEATMEPFFGRLIISSTPEKARVLINDVSSGTTPYDSTGIKPNTYRIRLELDDYVPWTTQQIIKRNKTDTLSVNLIPVAVRDSLRKVHAHRFKIVRRIVFGSLTAGFFAAGTYYNSRADEQLGTERDAWNSYMEENLSTGEYDTRYARYEEEAETTDLFFKRRNAMYVLGGIFCVGLAISIPF